MSRNLATQVLGLILIAILVPGLLLWSQDPKQVIQQRIGQFKQTLAQSQAQMRTYQWVETTEISLKGEVKKREQNECRYGPDGKVQKTAVGGAPEESKSGKPRGLKGKVAAKKVDELKDYMDRFGSLISRYVPPEGELIQAAFQAGKVSINPSAGGTLASLVIKDYIKAGDEVAITLDTAAKALRGYNVRTYLDGPADTALLAVRFSSLADGTNFAEETLLDSKSKQLQIKKTDFGHRKIAQ